jgi:D-apionolactonase
MIVLVDTTFLERFSFMLNKNLFYYGREGSLPSARALKAGPFSLVFEEGGLRYLRVAHCEVVRGIYAAVRDRNWGTVTPRFSGLQIHADSDHFLIMFEAEHCQAEIDFAWKGQIEGSRDGTIHFSMEGLARSTFLKSRIGFCVLHPVRECAGTSFVVERGDGRRVEGHFPRSICSLQSVPGMEEMQSLSYPVLPGLTARIQFSGDLFETEDQRNWTDASFKTFCTPLGLPYPVEVVQGTRISQSVTLTLEGEAPVSQQSSSQAGVKISLDLGVRSRLPQLGLCASSDGGGLSEREIQRLKRLHLSHLRVDVVPSETGFENTLARVSAEARALGIGLEIALFLSTDARHELRRIGELVRTRRYPVCTWLIFSRDEWVTPPLLAILARESLQQLTPKARFGAGTNAYFCELNSARPAYAGIDSICYSMNPQGHAFDNASLVETLEMQKVTVLNARELGGSLPVVISPVTLKPPFNPYVTAPPPTTKPDELPSQVDVRQLSLLGAGWTLGSLKYLAESGVISATYYETTGWRGVMERAGGSPLPELFRSLPGSVFPLYHTMADVGEFRDGEILAMESNAPLKATGLAFFRDDTKRLLMANLTSDPQRVVVEGIAARARLWLLNEDSVMQAMTSPEEFRSRPGDPLQTSAGILELTLSPYAVARIDEDPR